MCDCGGVGLVKVCIFHNQKMYFFLIFICEFCSFFQISDFVPYLDICSGSCIMKVRELASVCLVSFLSSPDSLLNWLVLLTDRIKNKATLVPKNQLHGFLLQVRVFIL